MLSLFFLEICKRISQFPSILGGYFEKEKKKGKKEEEKSSFFILKVYWDFFFRLEYYI